MSDSEQKPSHADEQFKKELSVILRQVQKTHMPFGKFGPANFPPAGVPVYDLPYEYLNYFERKGYPRGQLGKLLKFVHDVKRDGAEEIFGPMRKMAGGRTNLRKKRPRSLRFDEE
ncbi:MAG: DUF3820 family protein [Candidatus Pacebacteria bacterium]|nr:DUF3820 family protein [Candidatus Paceibacterota bacterium]